MNILLLEDNKTDADLTKRGLIDSIPNCKVEIASTLKQAREELSKDIPFDTAILDMQLPDGSGLDLLVEIRQSESEMPVIILTGSGNEEVAVTALQAGADDYIMKHEGYITKLPGAISFIIDNHKQNLLIQSDIIEVLYIEHHSSDIDLTIRHLHQYAPKIHVTPVSTAEEALQLIPENETTACSYNVILLDYSLPGLNALEFTKIIRQERKLQLPIILVTGHGNEDVAIHALKLGVNEYLVKRENYLYRLPSIILNVHQYQELAKKQLALAESEAKYRLLAENSADVIFTLGLDLNYTYVSPSVYKLRGYTPKEALGQPIESSLTPDSYQRAIQLISAKLSEAENSSSVQVETVNVEIELIKKDKSTVWTEIKATILLDENKKPKGILGVARDISQRKHYEDELYQSREEYKLFFEDDLTGDYLATTDGQLLNCNPAYIQILGLKSKEEALSLNLNEIYKNPEVRNTILQELRKHGRLFNHEYELMRADGKTVYGIANIIGIFNAQNELVSNRGYIFDNTKRKLVTDELQKLSQAVNQSPVSIVITDVNGNIEFGNAKTAETTGYELEELIGNNPRILKSGETPDSEYQNLWSTISSGNEWNGEFHNRKKNGELYWESASISPIINNKGEITHYVAVKEDITEQKKMHEELVKSKNKAEESDRLKSAFLANMSHEIRTPMNGILGFAELLRMQGLSGDQQQEYIGIIKKSGDRMLNIINDIVDISKIESGLVEVVLKESNINEQTDFVYTFFKPQAESKKIRLSYKNGLPADEALIITDKEKVFAILTNLIKNAIKYTDNGTIEFGYILKPFVQPSTREVVQSSDRAVESHELEFFVKDTGIGIPADRKLAIFDRFVQADISDTRAFQGAGLGLSISKAYVEMLGGKLWLESEEGEGSTFYFTLPYNTVQKVKPESLTANSQKVATDQLKRFKILIVEDDEISEMLIQIALKSITEEFFTVTSGIEAINACRIHPDLDLVLMDIKMPGMDGYEATRQIREFNKKVVIIAQTAYGLGGDKEKAMAAGCNGYISKPLNISVLKGLIQQHFKYQ